MAAPGCEAGTKGSNFLRYIRLTLTVEASGPSSFDLVLVETRTNIRIYTITISISINIKQLGSEGPWLTALL